VPSEVSRQRQASTLQKFCALVGNFPIAKLDRKYIDRLLQDMPTVGVARTCLITIRADPTAGHWPLGTRERLALALLVFTGQRRSDVLRMGRHRDGVLTIKQKKTGVQVDVPVHPELAAAIAACPSEHLTYLTTERGAPCQRAGVQSLVPRRGPCRRPARKLRPTRPA
jgi:integrase